MSHVATISIKCKDVNAIKRACARIGGTYCGRDFFRFYDNQEFLGHIVQLPGWQYPICITDDGNIQYDNFNGEWGSTETLQQFQQLYAIEAAKCAAEEQSYAYTEEVLPTGVLKLTIEI